MDPTGWSPRQMGWKGSIMKRFLLFAALLALTLSLCIACGDDDDDDDDDTTPDGRTAEQVCELYAGCFGEPESLREYFLDCMGFPGHCVVECAGELNTCNYDAARAFWDCASDCEAW